jgi:hypothetical protein
LDGKQVTLIDTGIPLLKAKKKARNK